MGLKASKFYDSPSIGHSLRLLYTHPKFLHYIKIDAYSVETVAGTWVRMLKKRIIHCNRFRNEQSTVPQEINVWKNLQ